EMRATKPATNGEKAITQHQMKTVHQPFQLSCQVSSDDAVIWKSVKKLIEMKFCAKLPNVCVRVEIRYSVGPKTKTATTSTILKTELRHDSRPVPSLIPIKAATPVTAANAPITIIHITGPDPIPGNEVTPEPNCIAANPTDVANPSTVAIIARSSTSTPAGRCT